MDPSRKIRKIAFIGTYLPRQCGIGTFTTDLLNAVAAETPEARTFSVAMNDVPGGYRYPEQVRFEVMQSDLSDYRRAADFLNISNVDIVCLQHEYGIYGGKWGSYIIRLLSNLRVPVVTTLHTVLREPDDARRSVLREVAKISDRVVVMSRKAEGFLNDVYDVPDNKVAFIHHGVHDVPFVDPNYYKDLFGVEGRKVILTFGLLSPGKGIEYMIEALPEVVKKHPDTIYIVLGATHPHVIRRHGEDYRLSLQRTARDLGVHENVVFHNRFVETEELQEFLGASDLYVTPYLVPEQITSGTLAYAIGSGKAIVSTPYWYAEEMLAEERGVLAPFKDPGALSEAILELFDNEVERHAMRKRAYTYGRQMIWREIARSYIETFEAVIEERAMHPRAFRPPRVDTPLQTELPPLNLQHLFRLTDDTGIIQQARFTVPNPEDGYSTKDIARALMVAVMANEEATYSERLGHLASTYLAFLLNALDTRTGRFRNILSYDRRWKDESGSEEVHGWSTLGLGVAVGHTSEEGLKSLSANLFEQALPATEKFTTPRALALTLLGIHEYLRQFSGATDVRRTREVLASRLMEMWKANSDKQWLWFEDTVTYANAALPHAMLLSGQWMGKPEMYEAGLKSLGWLAEIQTGDNKQFTPVGSNGYYPKGESKARFDQLPIDAHAMVSACLEAYRSTDRDRKKWYDEARRAFEWFLGVNDLRLPLYDPNTGGCRDGLHPDRVNSNQGAEATVSWLLTLLEMQRAERLVEEKSG